MPTLHINYNQPLKMEFSANQIAALVNGNVEGDGEVKINTFAKIEEGHPGAISFLANPKYIHYIYTCLLYTSRCV